MADAEEKEPGGAPATLADVRSLLAQRDELIAGLLQDCDGQTAHFRRTSGSAALSCTLKPSGSEMTFSASAGFTNGVVISCVLVNCCAAAFSNTEPSRQTLNSVRHFIDSVRGISTR